MIALLGCGRGPLYFIEPDCDGQVPAFCGTPATPRGQPAARSVPAGAALPTCAPTFVCFELGSRNFFARCNPRQVETQPAGFMCCSDDPAAPGGALPDFEERGIDGGPPYFAGDDNVLSTSGVLVRSDGVDDALIEDAAAGCPVPCNPTWPAADVATVCGAGRACCQTAPLAAADCVRDETTGLFRPVTGADIGTLSNWNPAAHATHQDPAGVACTGFAMGDQAGDVFLECIRELTVANQRGICMDVDDCLVDPDHRTACDELND